MVKHQLFIGAALLAGVAIGYFVRPSDEAPPAAERVKETRPSKPKREPDPSIAALKARIADLEKRLSAVPVAEETSPREAEPTPDEGRPPRRFSLEELKKNDPARYVQVTNGIATMRRRHREGQQAKLDFLGSLDVSGMGSNAKRTHERFQDLIVTRDAIEEALGAEGLSDEERHEIFGRLRENGEEMRKLAAEERRNLLQEVAKTMGLEGEAATDFSETIREVVNATESFGFGPRGFGGPRGGRGGRPGRDR